MALHVGAADYLVGANLPRAREGIPASKEKY